MGSSSNTTPITGNIHHTRRQSHFPKAFTYNPDLPAIPENPNITADKLTRKATLTGVTYLLESPYKSRLTGNKQCATDANGHLWLSANELKKEIHPDKQKKKPRIEMQGFKIFVKYNYTFVGRIANVIKNEACKAFELLFIEIFITFPAQQPKEPLPPREYSIKKTVVRQRLLNYINSQQGKKRLFFFTVTFPKATPDNIAYKMYNSWLTHLRKYKMLKEYLWVAERQENGTIHFHIAVPHYMDVRKANAMMAGTLKTYVQKGLLNTISVFACKKYNGVDIAKNRKTGKVVNFAIKKGGKALGNYLTKYVTKNNATFTHLAWHNSRGFSCLFTGVTFTKSEFQKNGFWKMLDFDKQFKSEFAIFVPWKGNPPPELTQYLFDINSFIQSQLN